MIPIELRRLAATQTYVKNQQHNLRKKNLHWVKTVVEDKGEPKTPFSLATKKRRKGGRNSIPSIAPLYPWSLPYNAESLARRQKIHFFQSLVWLDMRLNTDWATQKYCKCRLCDDRAGNGGTIPGQSWPGSNSNEGAHHIPQSSRDGAPPLDYLVSYAGLPLRES